MKRVQAKIEENRKENPLSEPDRDPNTWLIEAKLDEDIIDWETVRLDFRFDELEAEIVESSMSEPNRFTLRTHGESPLKKGDVIHVDVRKHNESWRIKPSEGKEETDCAENLLRSMAGALRQAVPKLLGLSPTLAEAFAEIEQTIQPIEKIRV
jgi:hypothetical protein